MRTFDLSIWKNDIDSCTLPQLISMLSQLEQKDVDVVTLFLHSFSFIKKWHSDISKRKADTNDIVDFDEVLRFLSSDSGFQIISASQFVDLYESNAMVISGSDHVPTYLQKISLLQYLRKKAGITRKNYTIYLAGSFVFVMIIAWIGLSMFRCKGKGEST